MQICPACKAIIKSLTDEKACPQCGHVMQSAGLQTDGPHAPTLDATAEFAVPPVSPVATEKGSPQATMEFSGRTEHSVNIAPRKLSRQSMDLITNTWQLAVNEGATERTSLKVDGASVSGMGSSLVVNLRGLRGSDEDAVRPRSTSGADYELLQVIGKGGMGVVYSARQASVDRVVAVKMIRPQVAAHPERREKFLSEAVVTGDLDHPNIVPIYELGSDENNALFYSMKRVQGTPWSHAISNKKLGENLEILMKVADAVAFAHANGVVHRDLKPENVMLGDFGEVLVMDWGLALATAGFRHAEFVTSADSMGGTPAYMAPEMVTGPFEAIGPPCDIYLLGALLFEVATGLRPHHGKTAQECLFAAARNEIQPTEKSGELLDIAYRAMATRPEDRFASVQAFQAALREYHSHMESISLSTRADSELSQARASGNYQSFARALFGFEEAYALWSGNERASAGVQEVRLAYATRAKLQGDFELASSLLDAKNPRQISLLNEIEAAQRERSARQKWLSRFKRIAAALAVLVAGTISIALVLVTTAKNREAEQRRHAEEQTVIATQQQQEAVRQKSLADVQRDEAERQTVIANQQREKAVEQTQVAEAERAKALAAEKQAEIERDRAEAARLVAEEKEAEAVVAKQGEERAAYVARIGMAAAKIEENAFDTAATLLAACQPIELRQWEWGFLKRRTTQGVTLPATGAVRAVAFAPDDSWFVTVGDDQNAHAWDRTTGKPRWTFDAHSALHALAISPDGQRVALGNDDGVIRILTAGGDESFQLTGHRSRVLTLDFSPDAKQVVSASIDQTTRIWNLANQSEIAGSPLQGHYGAVWDASFSPDGNRIVTSGEDGRVIVWSLNQAPRNANGSLSAAKVFLGHQGPVFAAAFSPDGQQIASAGFDKRILLWRPQSIADVELTQLVAASQPLAPQVSRAFDGHLGPVRAVHFSPTGDFVVSASDDNTIRVWDVATLRPHAQLRGHSRPVLACALAKSGRQLLSAGLEGEIKLWELFDYKAAPQGLPLAGPTDSVLAASFSRDGQHVISAGGDHAARVYDSATGVCTATLSEGHDFLATSALYFDDGRRLLTAGGDRTARIWDSSSAAQLQVLENTSRNATIAISADSRWLLTGNGEVSAQQGEFEARPQLTLWRLDDGRNLATRQVLADPAFGQGHYALVTALAVSPDGQLLFSGDDAGGGRLWNNGTGTLAHQLKGHTTRISAAAFLPDGKRLLTSSHDGTVAQWDTSTGQELPGMLVHGDPDRRDAIDTPVIGMTVSPNGKQVVTLSEDNQQGQQQSVLRVWDLKTGVATRELYRGPEALTSVSFTIDGQGVLAAGTAMQSDASEGGLARWFEVASGREVAPIPGKPYLDLTDHREGIWTALDSPQGGLLAVGGNGAALWTAPGASQPELVYKPHSGLTATGFSASGKYAVTASTDHRAKVWNIATGLAEVQLSTTPAAALSSATFSPLEDELVLTASQDGTARLWHWPTRAVRKVFPHGTLGGTASSVTAIFSPNGNQILTAGHDAMLRIWNAADGKALLEWKCESPILSAAYSQDGRRILVGLDNGQAMLVTADSQVVLARYLGHTDAVTAVGFSPNGKRVLTGSRDRSVKVWDGSNDIRPASAQRGQAVNGKELLTLRYHEQAITAVGFSPDGQSILSASLDGKAIIWSADDWQSP